MKYLVQKIKAVIQKFTVKEDEKILMSVFLQFDSKKPCAIKRE
jgi:hypothetical protein